jgi:hypothetical protein
LSTPMTSTMSNFNFPGGYDVQPPATQKQAAEPMPTDRSPALSTKHASLKE